MVALVLVQYYYMEFRVSSVSLCFHAKILDETQARLPTIPEKYSVNKPGWILS